MPNNESFFKKKLKRKSYAVDTPDFIQIFLHLIYFGEP